MCFVERASAAVTYETEILLLFFKVYVHTHAILYICFLHTVIYNIINDDVLTPMFTLYMREVRLLMHGRDGVCEDFHLNKQFLVPSLAYEFYYHPKPHDDVVLFI